MQFLGIYWFQARVQATCLDRSDQRQDHHPHQYHAPRNATPPSPDAGSVRDATHVLDVLTYIFLIYLQCPSRAGCRNQHLKFACFGPEPIYIVYIYIIPMCIYIYVSILFIFIILYLFLNFVSTCQTRWGLLITVYTKTSTIFCELRWDRSSDHDPVTVFRIQWAPCSPLLRQA